MKKVLAGCGFILLLTESSKAGLLADFEVSVGGVQQEPSGYASYKPATGGDRIDLKNDAHVGGKIQPWVKLKLEHPIPFIPNFKLGYMPMKFDGSGTLTRNIRWGNYTYTANADFDLSVKLDRVDATIYYNLPFIGSATSGILDIELGVNLRAVNFDATLSSTIGGQRVSEGKSLTLPIPMGHVATEIRPIKQVSLIGGLNYIGYSGNTYYDYTVGLRLNSHGIIQFPLKPFVELGYRYEKLKIDVSDVDADVEVKGGYALVGVRF